MFSSFFVEITKTFFHKVDSNAADVLKQCLVEFASTRVLGTIRLSNNKYNKYS